MKPDTITHDRLAALVELMEASTETIRRVNQQVLQAVLTAEGASIIVNEVAGTISQFCKK